MKNYFEVFNFNNLISTRHGVIGVVSGAGGSLLSKIYGGDMFVYFALILSLAIAFDWAGAIAASKKDGSYASAYGIQGVMRVAVMLGLPAFGGALDHILGTPNVIFFMFWGGLLFHTLVSMSANFKRAGWNVWIPTWAIDLVASEIEAKIKRSESRKGESQ